MDIKNGVLYLADIDVKHRVLDLGCIDIKHRMLPLPQYEPRFYKPGNTL